MEEWNTFWLEKEIVEWMQFEKWYISPQMVTNPEKMEAVAEWSHILVTNYSNDPFKGGAVYSKNNYCIDIVEKPPKGKSKSNLNNCGIFIFSIEIFEVLDKLKPSERGEIELTQALRNGILERDWKIFLIKMKRNQFRGDFGNKKLYENLSD